MRSSNPVLTRTDFGQSEQMHSGRPVGFTFDQPNGPGFGQQPSYGYTQPGYGSWQQAQQDWAASPTQPATGRMTIDSVVTKTTALLLVLVAAAAVVWLLLPVQLLFPVALLGSFVVFATVMVVSMRRRVPVGGVIFYAVAEGAVIGAWSSILNSIYPGIVMQAVLGTLLAAFATLGAYRFGNIRVRGRLAQVVVIGIFAYAMISLLNLVLAVFGSDFGWATFGPSAGILSWLSAGVGVFLAVASLLMDFDEIERGIRAGAPEQESWRGAFGLTVTLVWLYTLIVRILSFLRQN